jgi:hypothetical protein
LPPLPNLQFINVRQSSQLSIVNGETSSTLSLHYTLQATQPGDVTIPAMQVSADGRLLTTQPLRLKVVKSDAPAQLETAFLRLVVAKTNVYVGEPFPVEIQLYWQNAQDIQMPQLKAEGFSLGQSPKPTQTRTQVGGAIYNVATFKMASTAAKAGTLTLGPAECRLNIQVPRARQRQRDLFDFFGSPVELRPALLRSEPQMMQVSPLPTNDVPETFNGAVGSFTLSLSASPTNLAVGDPITVKVQIAGGGTLERLALPDQAHWREFKVYPPTSRIESGDPLGLSGAKLFEQAVIPQNHEIRALPPLVFSFFDPDRKSYRTLQSPAVPITVRPSALAATPLPLSTNAAGARDPAIRPNDLLHIKTHLGLVSQPSPPLWQRSWFLSLQAVPVLTWLAALLWRKRQDMLSNNPRLRRRRETEKQVHSGLVELRRFVENNQAEEFFATLFRLLQMQIGDRLDLPASSITESVIDERLRARGLSEETLATLHELFQTCNQARYALQQSREGLSALLPQVQSVVAALQKIKG